MTNTPGPSVSVVLPTYNRLRTLPRAVASVLEQDYADLELIVVDDAGNDGSERWLAELAAREPRVRVLRHERNGGVSRARNTGIAAARGEFVAFQDSDDEWLPGRMRTMMACFERQATDVGAVAGALLRYSRRGQVTCTWLPPRAGEPWQAVDLETIASACFAHCQALVVRRTLLVELGGFDTALQSGEDWDLCLRLVRRSGIVELGEPVTRAHASSDSLTRRRAQLTTAYDRVLARDGAQMRPETRARIHRIAGLDAAVAGDAEAARAHLRQALELTPGNPRLRLLRALVEFSPRIGGAIVQLWRELRRASGLTP